MVALGRVIAVAEECSGLGGTHVVFEIIGQGRGDVVVRVAHWGGHGFYGAGGVVAGQYYVLGIEPFPQPKQVHNPGWCLNGLPAADGAVIALVAAADQNVGMALMEQIAGP